MKTVPIDMAATWLLSILLQCYFGILELTSLHGITTALSMADNRTCCNDILGYAGPDPFIPCSNMKCCNSSETVALQRVNHALGFCFRCMPRTPFQTKCYKMGQDVASTNETKIDYTFRTCCPGLKFKVFAHTNDTALIIKCVRR